MAKSKPLVFEPLQLAFKEHALIGERVQIHGAPFQLMLEDATRILEAAGATVVSDQEQPTMLVTSDPNADSEALSAARRQGVCVIPDVLLLIWVNHRADLDALRGKLRTDITRRQMASIYLAIDPAMWRADRQALVQLVRLYTLRGATVIFSDCPPDLAHATVVVPTSAHISHVLRHADPAQGAITASDLNDAVVDTPGPLVTSKIAGMCFPRPPLVLHDAFAGADQTPYAVKF